MNILLVSKYDIEQGGVAGVLQSLKDYLLSHHHRVIMLTHDRNMKAQDLMQQLKSIETNQNTAILKVDFGLAKLWPSLFYKKQFKKILRHFNIDVIHSHGISRSEIAYRMSQSSHTPLIVTSHGDLNHKHVDAFKRKIKIRKILSHANYVTHLTQPMAMKANRILDTTHKSKIIHNGIDLQPWPEASADKKNYCIAVGRFVNQKGFHIALKAYAKARDAGFTQGLVLLGDGPEKHPLQSLANQLKIQIKEALPEGDAEANTVYMPGYLTGQTKIDLLRAATCLLFPSQTDEAFSLVLLEAMAAGLAVIASDFPMTQYLKQCGMASELIPHQSVSAWQKSLTQAEAKWFIEAGKHNRKTVNQFEINHIHQQYEKLYGIAS